MKVLSVLALLLAVCSVSSSSIQRESQNVGIFDKAYVGTACPSGGTRITTLPNRGDYTYNKNFALYNNAQCSTAIGTPFGSKQRYRCVMRLSYGASLRVYMPFRTYFYLRCPTRYCYRAFDITINFIGVITTFRAGSGWGGGFACRIDHV